MKELYSALKEFVRHDFHAGVYGFVMLFLTVALFINYSQTVDIGVFHLGNGFWQRLGYYGTLFGGTYFLAALVSAWKSKVPFLKDWRFWTLALLFVLLASAPKLHIFPLIDIRAQDWSLPEKVFVSRCHFFFHQMVITLVGLWLIRLLFSRWAVLDYGFRFNWETLRPYFLVLLLVSPLVIGASFFPDFQRAYPQYKPWKYTDVFGWGIANRAMIFEMCYATGFIAVEAIFRGALALTLVRVMGARAVLAMAAFYCVFHFGKPAGEAVGAFFGGYILGVLAIHSRSIVGGIIVHLGVAMLMEALAYLHHYL